MKKETEARITAIGSMIIWLSTLAVVLMFTTRYSGSRIIGGALAMYVLFSTFFMTKTITYNEQIIYEMESENDD